jgi:hypothetical protein
VTAERSCGEAAAQDRSAARRRPSVRSWTSLGSAPGPEQLGQRARGGPAQLVHLEQPVGAVHPSLGEEQIVRVPRGQVRDAVGGAGQP